MTVVRESEPLADFDERLQTFLDKLKGQPGACELLQRSADRIDRAKVKALQENYRARLKGPWDDPFYKDLDLARNLYRQSHFLAECELDLALPKRILDIAARGGALLFCAESAGHNGVCTELPVDYYDDMFALFGVPFIHHCVTPNSVPPLEGPFDLIVSTGVLFNEEGWQSGIFWSPTDWARFLDELSSKLAAGGEIVLQLNTQARGDGPPHVDGLMDFFEAHGARTVRHRNIVRLDGEALRRLAPKPKPKARPKLKAKKKPKAKPKPAAKRKLKAKAKAKPRAKPRKRKR